MRFPKPTDRALRFSRACAATKNPAELRLFWELKRRWREISFEYQAPFGPFIADFLFRGARLVVEVDGAGHRVASQREKDARRDAFMRSNGFRILRVSAGRVFDDVDSVLDDVADAISDRRAKPSRKKRRKKRKRYGKKSQPGQLFTTRFPGHPGVYRRPRPKLP